MRIARQILLFAAAVSVFCASARGADRKPQRIISSAPVVTEILFAIGAGDEVVGVDEFSKYPPEAAKIKSIGALRNLHTETLIALQPTLVVIYGQNPDLEAFSKQRGAAKVNVMIENTEDLYKTITALGTAAGREKKATELVEQIRNRLIDIRGHNFSLQMDLLMKAKGGEVQKLDEPHQKVLLVVGREAGSFQNVLTVGSGSFLDELITKAGGKNVFADIKQPYPIISSEQIIAAAPDVIIEMSGENGEMKDIEQRKKDWQAFKSVPAVKNGRIQFLSGDYLLIPGPRIGKTAEDLVKVLHP
jgi:iron complex transport system substrate-binding protein